MSLLNSLYFIVSGLEPTTPNEPASPTEQAEYTIRFDAAHPIFAGHFPGQPIVPGACLVQIAEELTALLTQQPVRFATIRNLKFRHPITPDEEVTVTLRCEQSRVQCQIAQPLVADSVSFSATYMCAHSDLQ